MSVPHKITGLFLDTHKMQSKIIGLNNTFSGLEVGFYFIFITKSCLAITRQLSEPKDSYLKNSIVNVASPSSAKIPQGFWFI